VAIAPQGKLETTARTSVASSRCRTGVAFWKTLGIAK
jgi:hypothetical protein